MGDPLQPPASRRSARGVGRPGTSNQRRAGTSRSADKGTTTLTLRARPGQAARTAELALRVVEVSIPQPRSRTPICVIAIFGACGRRWWNCGKCVRRRASPHCDGLVDQPAGVATLRDALDIAAIYEQRWLIEELHKAMKTGCQLEDRQYESPTAWKGLPGSPACWPYGAGAEATGPFGS
ncbi:MAG: hypothetical protein U0894_01280 [Pirellulales bacterium]